MRRKEDKKAAIPQAPGGSTQPGPDRTSTANTRTTDADAETKSVEPKSSQYDILVESNGAVPRSGESYRSAAVAPSHSRSTGVGMLLSERLNKRVRSLEPMDSAGEKKRKQLRPSRSPSPTRNGTSSRHGLQEDLNPKYEGRRSSNEAGNSRYRTRIEAIPALFMSL